MENSQHYEDGKAKVDLLKSAKLDTVLKGKMDYVDYLKLDVQVSSCHLLISNSRIRA